MVNQSKLVENLSVSIWQSDNSLSCNSKIAPRLVKFKSGGLTPCCLGNVKLVLILILIFYLRSINPIVSTISRI